jgi:N-acetylmuramoyl-L-alanine amidase
MKTVVLWALSVAAFTTTIAATAADRCAVAIDVGHSQSAPGATSARGIPEFLFNRNLANVLLEKLQQSRSIEPFLIVPLGKPLRARTELATADKADLFISIHHDSVQPSYLKNWTYQGALQHYSDRFHGFSLFVSRKNPHVREGLELARDIGSNLLTAGFTPSLHHAEKIKGENRELLDPGRGIYVFDDLVVLKTATMPAVLLECGIIVNRQEEKELSDSAVEAAFAAAISEGIERFCERQRLAESGR